VDGLAWPGPGVSARAPEPAEGPLAYRGALQNTSLPPERAGPADLLRLSRVHWAIENELHYVRDVTLGEDASRIRSGAAPQAMAAMRNLVVAMLHRHGLSNRAAGLRHFAWHPDQAAQALGLTGPPLPATSRVA
jgi:hypothetical protein